MCVEYKLRDEIKAIQVCLYSPGSEDPFIIEDLNGYVSSCRWKMENGEPITRFPFYLAPAQSDAQHAIDEFRQLIAEQRKAELIKETKPETKAKQKPKKAEVQPFDYCYL